MGQQYGSMVVWYNPWYGTSIGRDSFSREYGICVSNVWYGTARCMVQYQSVAYGLVQCKALTRGLFKQLHAG